MDVQETLQKWDFCDQAIIGHGFTSYNRDYVLNVIISSAYQAEQSVTYLFRGCVAVTYESLVNFSSLDDTFIDYSRWEAAGCPDGFVWGVNWAVAYPGWKYIENSKEALDWAQKLNLSMHEVEIVTNTYRLTLVFHDLAVKPGSTSPTPLNG